MKLEKYPGGAILLPNPGRAWESLVATNPGAWYNEASREFLLVYRAAGEDLEHTIRLGLAKSCDGMHFERASERPLFEPEPGSWDFGGTEDPRIVKFGDWYFGTYAARPFKPGRYWEKADNAPELPTGLPDEAPSCLRLNRTRTGLFLTKDFRRFLRPGYLSDPSLDDRDIVIFPEKIDGKFILFHRPMEWIGPSYGCDKPSIWIEKTDDLLAQGRRLELFMTAERDWEEKVGGASPPIKTDAGWLALYHAVGPDKRYRVGAVLLDLERPEIIRHRSPEPILEPEFDYECEGIYKGICFPCGNVVAGGRLYVYYGAADQRVGLATCELDELVDWLLKCSA
jgi:predicted GH43/DUF377 family glycosyl hydrolase